MRFFPGGVHDRILSSLIPLCHTYSVTGSCANAAAAATELTMTTVGDDYIDSGV